MTIEFPKDLYPFPIRVCPCPGLRFYVPIRYGGSFALYAPTLSMQVSKPPSTKFRCRGCRERQSRERRSRRLDPRSRPFFYLWTFIDRPHYDARSPVHVCADRSGALARSRGLCSRSGALARRRGANRQAACASGSASDSTCGECSTFSQGGSEGASPTTMREESQTNATHT